MDPFQTIVTIVNKHRRGGTPTKAEFNILNKSHFNMKQIINRMPPGRAKNNLLTRWNFIGSYLNGLSMYLINRNIRERVHRRQSVSNRTRN